MNKTIKLVLLALLVAVFITVVSYQVGMRGERAAAAEEIQGLRARLAEAQGQIEDWAQLRRYAEANSRVPTPQEGERRVVFIGDSITDNWGKEGFGQFFPAEPYINRGISGQKTGQMLVRFRQDVIALSPRAVVILGGTNDFNADDVETTVDNLASMAELASSHNIRVILASVPPVNDYARQTDGQPIVRTRQRPLARIISLNDRIKEYAARNGFTYLDYYRALADDKGMLRADLADDGLHPNARGYAVMTPLAEQAINDALNSKPR